MTVVLTAGLILLFLAGFGAAVAVAAALTETLTRRIAVAQLIGGAENLLRNSAS